MPLLHHIKKLFQVFPGFLLLVCILAFAMTLPGFAEEKLKDETVKASIDIDESVTSEYTIPGGVMLRDRRIQDKTIEDGKIKISGKKTVEDNLSPDSEGAIKKKTLIREEIQFINQVTPRTMLKAVFSETNENSFINTNSVQLQARHNVNNRLSLFFSTTHAEAMNSAAKIRHETKLSSTLTDTTSVELAGAQELSDGTTVDKVGVRVNQKITPSLRFGVSMNREFSNRIYQSDNKRVSLDKSLGESSSMGTWYKLSESRQDPATSAMGVSFRQNFLAPNLQFNASYEYNFGPAGGNTTLHRASIGVSKETGLGSLSVKYLQEMPGSVRWRESDRGFFMGLTRKF